MWVINTLLAMILAMNPAWGQQLIDGGWQLWYWMPQPGAVIHHLGNYIR